MSEKDHTAGSSENEVQLDEAQLGLAGRTARFFIRSPLSPLLFISMMLMGFMGLVLTPRQEDPQISVPMVDIMVQYPGAEADQVASLAIQPLERIVSEIKGVKHVYSASMRGQGVVTIQFEVGEEMGPSLVKVNDKLDSNKDKIPPGVMPPLVKAKGIDDVPVVNITLWAKDLDSNRMPDVDDGQLRMLAHSVLQSIKEIPDTGGGFVVGGRAEQVTVEVFPERLSGYQISLDQVARTIQAHNSEQQAGGVEAGNTRFTVVTGSFLRTAEDINRLVVGTYNDVPVYVHDVAQVTQGPQDAEQLVAYYTGAAAEEGLRADGVGAVTIAIAKKKGSNGVTVANEVLKRVDELKGKLIPANVEVSITRNYGETADDKVNELIFKLFVATSFVFFLVLGAFRAFRPAIVVVLVIPVVLLFTVFCAWLTGYTIDRVSLFALIFSIGILVDDAIVVVENIYRRWLEEGRTDVNTAIDAVREVGNPTILATFTVIGALLPMGFVSGMMGPYMEPIPALGSAAMLISLFAAFVFTPYLATSHWLRPSMNYLRRAEEREHQESERLEGLFRRILLPLIEHRHKRLLFRLVLWGAFFVALSFFYTKWVAVKMLPLDNKPEFTVVLDMPEGTALPLTANMASRMAEKLRQFPEVTAVQVYAGTARPFDFNGMVRHYYMRQSPWQGEVQVQLLHKSKRKRSSHQIAVAAREELQPLMEGTGGRYSVVEMPPGPPVLQSVVAEVHGPSAEVRRRVATDLTKMFAETENLVDVDNYLRDPYEFWRFTVDAEKAARRGVSVDSINRNLSMALGGMSLGDVKQRAGHEPVQIVMQVPLAERSDVNRLGDLPISSGTGATIPLRELGEFSKVPVEDIIYHKDLRDVEYVVADVGGRLAAPVYGMMQVEDLLKDYETPVGGTLETNWIGPPENDAKPSIEWAGEWTVTYETFRDMGAAFVVALVVIYMLVVWEFGNFRIPALIMAPIPLTLLGIIPAHMIFFQLGWGGEFTATSMIGWIALAGIIVRNSILLVDFSVHEIQHGSTVVEAVIRACKTRTRPILITALALVAGSSVIFFDPIFQGMAISLASGVLVSTVLTLIVIPLGCIAASKSLCEVAAAGMPAGQEMPCVLRDETTVSEPEQAKAAALAASVGKRTKPRKSALVAIWGKLVGAVMMGFYLLRMPFLLLAGLFKSRKRDAPTVARVSNPAVTPATGVSEQQSGAVDVPRSAVAEISGKAAVAKAPPVASEAATEPESSASVDKGTVAAVATGAVTAVRAPVATPRTASGAAATKTKEKPVAPVVEAKRPAAKKSAKQAAAPKSAVKKATLKNAEPAKPAAKTVPEKAKTAAKQPSPAKPKPAAVAKSNSAPTTAKPSVAEDVGDEDSDAQARRRGIRLKVISGGSDTGLD